MYILLIFFFFFKQKTAYEMRISDWSSDVCSSDLFDRDEKGRRIPFISALTALGAADGDTRSYIELLDLIRQNGALPETDAQEIWRRMVFNILISNTDDHLRNHGYLRDPAGWRLAPAYDLNPMPVDVKNRKSTRLKPSQ